MKHAQQALHRRLKTIGLAKILGRLLILASLNVSVRANIISPNGTANVTLTWTRIKNPIVVGYNIYYGGSSGVYTNETLAGLVTSLTVSNLIVGNTYYFAATTYSAAGAESAFSSAVSYTVPPPTPGVQLLVTTAGQFVLTVTGVNGHIYDIQATQDLKTWTVIGTVTVGVGGLLQFTDPNATSFSRRFYRTHDITP